ncbi:MAG: folate family ECF transporter S component [Oscillospiraceae bacterium]|nr:folate family ECF transporter S component [Oscillospiraceae bacterium]
MSTKTHTISENFRLFANARVLVVTALFIAMSIVLGKFLSITAGPVRISFENLTVLMSGIMFGPVIGLVTGAAADIIGCILYGYAINPIITLGASLIGLISGIVSHCTFKNKLLPRMALSVGLAHLIGSVIVKSIGMYVYFGYTIELLALRIPLYTGIGLVEFYIIYLLMKNRSFVRQLDKVYRK